MKLDRNLNPTGQGKYALINFRRADFDNEEVRHAFAVLQSHGAIDMGFVGDPDEFFVIKLRDQHARPALDAYAAAAWPDDPEWANEVADMAKRSGEDSPHCKRPD
jgi:hypothetical protein